MSRRHTGINHLKLPKWDAPQPPHTAAEQLAAPWESSGRFPTHTVLLDAAVVELAAKVALTGVALAAGAALAHKAIQAVQNDR